MEISQAKGRIAVYPLQRRAFSLVIVCERRKREKVEILLVVGQDRASYRIPSKIRKKRTNQDNILCGASTAVHRPNDAHLHG